MNPKILLVRILGNDLLSLHHNNQTNNNLQFIVKHEYTPPCVDKLYILNKIANKTKQRKLEQYLCQHDQQYIVIPYKAHEFHELPMLARKDYRLGYMRVFELQFLQPHNMYLINLNFARNKAIEHGREHGYDWILPFDSNNFVPKDTWDHLFVTMEAQPNVHYTVSSKNGCRMENCQCYLLCPHAVQSNNSKNLPHKSLNWDFIVIQAQIS